MLLSGAYEDSAIQEESRKVPLTHAEEQALVRRQFIEAANRDADADGQNAADVDDDGGSLFTVKKKSKKELEQEEEELRSFVPKTKVCHVVGSRMTAGTAIAAWVPVGIDHVRRCVVGTCCYNSVAQKKGAASYWGTQAADDQEEFLRKYIVNEGWIDKNKSAPSYNLDEFDDEEETLEQQEEYERKYNFRFEEEYG
jgi:hypothetical protein